MKRNYWYYYYFALLQRKLKQKTYYFHLDCIYKGAKLVEVESPEEDAYIQILANNLTGKPDSLVC